MPKQFSKTDYILWIITSVYTGIIYATLSLVTTIRKYLVEKFGYTVFDTVYWIFGIIAAAFLFYYFRKFRGRELIYKIVILALFACIYAYYLSGMRYPIEKIHFLEYGLLGAMVLIAFTRHIKNWTSIILSLNLVYWLGLGDEAIQGLLVNRVGEIRDSIINLFSGALAIVLLWLSNASERENRVLQPSHFKLILIFLAFSTLVTGLFLYTIHGFGYCIERKDTGRFYSSLPPGKLAIITKGARKTIPEEVAIYNNEALRHLFQREFYYTNDFKASDGTWYRQYLPCYYENRILELFYTRYLQEYAHQYAGALIRSMDKEVAAKTENNPLIWPDSVRAFMETFNEDQQLYCSRVKQTIITDFSPQDMLFACALIFLVLVFLWLKAAKRPFLPDK